MKPQFCIMKVLNFQKSVENQSWWAGKKPEDEHEKTKIPWLIK